MPRLPKQCASVDLRDSIFRSQQYCEGVTFEGKDGLQRLLHNTVDGPNFCSPQSGIRFGAFYSGLGF